MLDIIIVFIVIGMVIANIMKHVGSPGQWPKSDASGRPVVPGVPGHSKNEQEIYRQSGNRQVQMTSARKGEAISVSQGSVVDGHDAQREGFQIENPDNSSLEGIGLEGLKDMLRDDGIGAVRLEVMPSGARRHVLSFSRHDIINGVIMSELLQPPKALRKRTH